MASGPQFPQLQDGVRKHCQGSMEGRSWCAESTWEAFAVTLVLHEGDGALGLWEAGAPVPSGVSLPWLAHVPEVPSGAESWAVYSCQARRSAPACDSKSIFMPLEYHETPHSLCEEVTQPLCNCVNGRKLLQQAPGEACEPCLWWGKSTANLCSCSHVLMSGKYFGFLRSGREFILC